MVIEDRNLTPGARLVATYRKGTVTCLVTAGEDGKISFLLPDGRTFRSLSAAGSAIMNGVTCNGWRFWNLEGEAPVATEAKPTKAPKPAKEKANGEHRSIKRVPSQGGVADGMAKYFCDGCMKAFEHPTADGAPQACPEGHPAIVADAAPTA